MPKPFFDDGGAVFETMKQKYGIWPVTVWDCDFSDKIMQAAKASIGDIGGAMLRKGMQGYWYQPTKRRGGPASFPGEIGRSGKGGKYADVPQVSTREGCFRTPADDKSVYAGKVTASVFNPMVAQRILSCYAPKDGGVCFDPFGGGGTRAIVAVKNGLRYYGVELRQEEVDAVGMRCEHCGVTEGMMMFCGDSQDCSGFMADASADFCYTCPPYWNLEEYEGGAADLSMCLTYDGFLGGLERVVHETRRVLKPGSYSCWVVGLHRDSEGGLLALNHDVARIHQSNGFRFKEEVVLAHRNNGAIQRVGNFEKGDRRLIRAHEYVLVFVRK